MLNYLSSTYSQDAQLLLLFISCCTTFILYYLTTNIMLRIYGTQASPGKKVVFVLLVGLLLNNCVAYIAGVIGDSLQFSAFAYLLFMVPTPFFALLFYLLAIKILKLSAGPAMRITTHVYYYLLVIEYINRYVDEEFFRQPAAPEQLTLDIFSLLVCALLNIVIFLIIWNALHRFNLIIRITDRLFITSMKKEFLFSVLRMIAAYSITVAIPLLLPDLPIGHLLTAAIIALVLVFGIFVDAFRANRTEIENKDVYIKTLTNAVDEFSGVKHDFYNILQTYGGYLQTGDLDGLRAYHKSLYEMTLLAGSQLELNQKMSQNPALITLLLNKLEYAAKQHVHLRINLLCGVESLYMSNMDLCRSLACLLDNAIEAAAESQDKRVNFSIERKPNDSKLIIITNSTCGEVDTNAAFSFGSTTKNGHSGIGLPQVRKTFAKYGNCTFHASYYSYEFSVYIDVRPA